jgi:hypothetical protein
MAEVLDAASFDSDLRRSCAPQEAGATQGSEMRTAPKIALITAVFIILSSCGESNELIGKWRLTGQSKGSFLCVFLPRVEFTEKLIKSPMTTMTYTLDRDGSNYIIDTHEPGKNALLARINADKTMTLDMGMGLTCQFERDS